MKKLFVWHYNDGRVCALDEDGKMIYVILSDTPKETIQVFFVNNTALSSKYDIQIQDQKKLEEHMYGGADRDYGVPKDFQIAWDKHLAGTAVAMS